MRSSMLSKRLTARLGFHVSLVSALLMSLGSTHAQESNHGIRRVGTEITLFHDATNEDLEKLKGEKGITSVTSIVPPSGVAGPFITDAGLAHMAGWTELRVLR